jgi:hypothetical protein
VGGQFVEEKIGETGDLMALALVRKTFRVERRDVALHHLGPTANQGEHCAQEAEVVDVMLGHRAGFTSSEVE